MNTLLILIGLLIVLPLFFRTLKAILKIGLTLVVVYIVFQFIMQYI